jgi:hypothetical protein
VNLASALLPLLLTASSPAVAAPGAETSVLPFVEDDYPAALAQARERGVPVFVEAWAPW